MGKRQEALPLKKKAEMRNGRSVIHLATNT